MSNDGVSEPSRPERPETLVMLTICPGCAESAELRISKEDVQRMYESVKDVESGAVTISFECERCGKNLRGAMNKDQLRLALASLEQENVSAANVVNEKLLDTLRSENGS